MPKNIKMKRLFFITTLIASCIPAISYAGKWDKAARGIYIIGKNPDKALSFIGILIDLFLLCIPVAIIAGIVSIILKSVFDLDKADTQKAFFLIGGILLAIILLVYFLL